MTPDAVGRHAEFSRQPRYAEAGSARYRISSDTFPAGESRRFEDFFAFDFGFDVTFFLFLHSFFLSRPRFARFARAFSNMARYRVKLYSKRQPFSMIWRKKTTGRPQGRGGGYFYRRKSGKWSEKSARCDFVHTRRDTLRRTCEERQDTEGAAAMSPSSSSARPGHL